MVLNVLDGVWRWLFVPELVLAVSVFALDIVRRRRARTDVATSPLDVSRARRPRLTLRGAGVVLIVVAVAFVDDPHRDWTRPAGPSHVTGSLPNATNADHIYSVAVRTSPSWLLMRVWTGVHGAGHFTAPERRLQQTLNDVAHVERGAEVRGAAYAYSGRPVTITGDGVTASVGGASQGIATGDIIHTVAGHPVRSVGEYLAALFRAFRARDPFPVEVTRRGNPRDVTIDPTQPFHVAGRARTGFTVDVGPDPVAVVDDGTTGSSDGVALVLGILVQLGTIAAPTRPVVATGIVTVDGEVTDIADVDQKAVAAATVQPCVFLVPSHNVAAARKSRPHLNVVGIDTIDDAVHALTANGCYTPGTSSQ